MPKRRPKPIEQVSKEVKALKTKAIESIQTLKDLEDAFETESQQVYQRPLSIGDQVIVTKSVKIPVGATVMIYGISGNQYKVEYRHRYWWVDADCLEAHGQ